MSFSFLFQFASVLSPIWVGIILKGRASFSPFYVEAEIEGVIVDFALSSL